MVAISSQQIRRLIIEHSMRAGVGHIGSALSVADICCALYRDILKVDTPRDCDRDRFILSKGHAALALYATLHLKGFLSKQDLQSFCQDGSLLGVHPDRMLPGIDFTTGSLGLGLSFGTGAALAARMEQSTRRVFVLMSDAECNEGSVWEAVMFAAQHRLSNLIAVVDVNGQQALGATQDILCLDPLSAKWQAFGWDSHEIDGHQPDTMAALIRALDTSDGPPKVLLAKTVFGKGISFMEGRLAWHYQPMSQAEYLAASKELGAA